MLKIHHIRNATFIIETGKLFILVDPMLGDKASIPSFTYLRHKARKNPIISLPSNYKEMLDKTTHCIITHKHPDHFDKEGRAFLKQRNIPVYCSKKDSKDFRKIGLNIQKPIGYWTKQSFLGGTITGIPAQHGYGFIKMAMGNVMGYYVELPNIPSIYISSDTIFTSAVDRVLSEMKPELCVLACGSAQMDIGKPILMHMEDIILFVKNADKLVYANHLEAVNHCPTTRKHLTERLRREGLLEKVFIPDDGEIFTV